MPVGNVDNVFRAMAAAIRNSFSTALEGFLNGTAALPITSGGTGAPDAATARTNLGIPAVQPIAQGGTGQVTAAAAVDALGAVRVLAATLANPGYVKFNLPGVGVFMVAWGHFIAAPGSTFVNYAAPFPSAGFPVVSGNAELSSSAQDNNPAVYSDGASGFTVWNANNACTAWYVAVGY